MKYIVVKRRQKLSSCDIWKRSYDESWKIDKEAQKWFFTFWIPGFGSSDDFEISQVHNSESITFSFRENLIFAGKWPLHVFLVILSKSTLLTSVLIRGGRSHLHQCNFYRSFIQKFSTCIAGCEVTRGTMLIGCEILILPCRTGWCRIESPRRCFINPRIFQI